MRVALPLLLLTRDRLVSEGSPPMNDANTTASDDIQFDEAILTYTVSDEALEAAASKSGMFTMYSSQPCGCTWADCHLPGARRQA